MMLIGHRGAVAYAPESTRAAIRAALRCKVDMIELDVQVTRDGRLVIFHDRRLERTTDGRGLLVRHRYADLARLDAGSWFASRFAGERILLASQALRMIPAPCRINLELKSTRRPVLLIRQLARSLRWTGTVSRVLVSSFDARLLARLKQADRHVARALLCSRQPWRALRRAVRLNCVAFHPHYALITPALVTAAHAAGLRVHTWTVDRARDAARLAAMGVDGITSNAPDRLAAGRRRR